MILKKDLAISDSGFLFNPSSGDSYSLNPIGVEIFKYLQKGESDSAIINQLLSDYAVDQNTIEMDLDDFKVMLINHKLINV